MTGGHHGAFCTFASETGHKRNIKQASKLTRAYSSRNHTQNNMLNWDQQQQIWAACTSQNENLLNDGVRQSPQKSSRSSDSNNESCTSPQPKTIHKLGVLLPFANQWSRLTFTRGRAPVGWDSLFVSKQIRLTRREFLRILCKKFGIEDSFINHVSLLKQLTFQWAGECKITSDTMSRRFVGIEKTVTGRRDFVRVRAPAENNACLTARILGFVQIDGFDDVRISLPENLRHPATNTKSVVLAFVRWLSPHQSSLLRDENLLPICPPPFDMNHALWEFTHVVRPEINADVIQRNIDHYHINVDFSTELHAQFDVITPNSLSSYVNATIMDDGVTILETITLPF